MSTNIMPMCWLVSILLGLFDQVNVFMYLIVLYRFGYIVHTMVQDTIALVRKLMTSYQWNTSRLRYQLILTLFMLELATWALLRNQTRLPLMEVSRVTIGYCINNVPHSIL